MQTEKTKCMSDTEPHPFLGFPKGEWIWGHHTLEHWLLPPSCRAAPSATEGQLELRTWQTAQGPNHLSIVKGQAKLLK